MARRAGNAELRLPWPGRQGPDDAPGGADSHLISPGMPIWAAFDGPGASGDGGRDSAEFLDICDGAGSDNET